VASKPAILTRSGFDLARSRALIRFPAPATLAWIGWAVAGARAFAAGTTNREATATPIDVLPEAGLSALRVAGALAVVLALFLGGVWLFRNWQRLALRRGGSARLALLETRSLGNRQALFVVGYERQRMLLAASPAGVSLIAHLPEADDGTGVASPSPVPSFAAALQQMVKQR
jgi:flagellar biogenesis protein FliO